MSLATRLNKLQEAFQQKEQGAGKIVFINPAYGCSLRGEGECDMPLPCQIRGSGCRLRQNDLMIEFIRPC